MKPTVGFFVYNLRHYGGAARQAALLARHVHHQRVILFDVERGRTKVEVVDVPGQPRTIHVPSRLAAGVPAVMWHVLRERVDIVHLHGPVAAGLIVGRLLRRPTVLKSTLLGSDDFDALAGRRFGKTLLRLARRVDANVAVSEAIATINAKYLPRERIHRWPNAAERVTDARAKTAPVFCVVGLVCERKRTHLAIERFVASYAALAGAKLYVVGPTSDPGEFDEGGAAYLARCRGAVPEAYREKVIFTGMLEPPEVACIHAESLACFCFSESEGMPNAVLEAMAHNCVPILGEIGGVAREIVPDAATGFILAAGESMPRIGEVQAISASMAPAQRVREAFSFEALAAKYDTLYRSLL